MKKFRCLSAGTAANTARAYTSALIKHGVFDADVHGRANAFLHCYWSALMSARMGWRVAQGFGDRHETADSGLPMRMDQTNNSHGRVVGHVYGEVRSRSHCQKLATEGWLTTLCGSPNRLCWRRAGETGIR